MTTDTLERPKSDTAAAIVVTRDFLLTGMRAARAVIEGGSTIPVLSNLLFEAEGERLRLSGTNMEMLWSFDVPCECAGRAAFTVEARKVVDAVNTMRPGDITVMASDSWVTLKQKGSTRKLPTIPADLFPPIRVGDPLAEFSMPAAQLLTMLDATYPAAGQDEKRFDLHGVHIHADGDALAAVATDTYRLARVRMPLPDSAADMPPIIIALGSVKHMRSLLAAATADQMVTIRVTDKKLDITLGRQRFVAMLVEATFPQYKRIIPTPGDRQLLVHSAELLRGVRAAAVLTDGRTRGIVLSLDREGCVASGGATTGAEAVEPIDAEWASDPIRLGVNSEYAVAALQAFGDACQLQIDVRDEIMPMLIRSPDKPEITALLTPMRA